MRYHVEIKVELEAVDPVDALLLVEQLTEAISGISYVRAAVNYPIIADVTGI